MMVGGCKSLAILSIRFSNSKLLMVIKVGILNNIKLNIKENGKDDQ